MLKFKPDQFRNNPGYPQEYFAHNLAFQTNIIFVKQRTPSVDHRTAAQQKHKLFKDRNSPSRVKTLSSNPMTAYQPSFRFDLSNTLAISIKYRHAHRFRKAMQHSIGTQNRHYSIRTTVIQHSPEGSDASVYRTEASLDCCTQSSNISRLQTVPSLQVSCRTSHAQADSKTGRFSATV